MTPAQSYISGHIKCGGCGQQSPEGKAVWRCCPCGVEFTAYATVQKHIDTAHGGGRIEFVLDNKEGQE